MCDFQIRRSKGVYSQNILLNMEQILSLAGKIAISYLTSKYADPNRDKPPLPLAPVCLQPNTTGSLCAGLGLAENIDCLRLDVRGQTTHQDDIDEMSVHYIKRLYGLIKTVSWASGEKGAVTGSVLLDLDMTPSFGITSYPGIGVGSATCYYLPPVAVVSNLFGFWRGSIEYRFDFVCTRFHVGKLWVCYQPNVSRAMDYEQSRACIGIEIDLSEDRKQHTFTVPYIADRPFWPRRNPSGITGDAQRGPGRLVAYVIAPLTCTNAVAATIECNIYVRGGEDMEFSVPCQPSIGLSYNPFYPDHKGEHSIKPFIDGKNYAPNILDSWRYFMGSKKYILRWGEATDRIAQFSGVEPGCIYYFDATEKAKPGMDKWLVNITNVLVQVTRLYFVPVNVNDGDGWIYLAPCQTKADAMKYYGNGDYTYTDKTKKVLKVDGSFCIDVPSDTTNNNYSPNDAMGNPYVYTLIGEWAFDKPPFPSNDDDNNLQEFEVVGESDERTNQSVKITVQETGPNTSCALNMYGESFMDLKDLCRRYQPYWSWIYKEKQVFNKVVAILPAVPTGLQLEEHDEFSALCRDGHIPIVASGFRFYRGGLRFKLLNNFAMGGSIWLQVRPDRRFRSRSANFSPVTEFDSYFNHTYATAIQSLSVNPTITIEIPFYQPGEYGLLQPTSSEIYKDQASWHVSLGEIAIGFVNSNVINNTTHQLLMFYALADDCRFSVFQGFPPVIPLRDSLIKK